MKHKKKIILAAIALGIAVAGAFGLEVPAEIKEPLMIAICAISGGC